MPISLSISKYKVPLDSLRGLSKEIAKIMETEMNCKSVEDLLYYFPRRYIDRTIIDNPVMEVGSELTLIVQVKSAYLSHGRRSRLIVNCQSKQGIQINLIWFHSTRYFRKKIRKGMSLIVSGKLDFFQGLQITHPDFETLNENFDIDYDLDLELDNDTNSKFQPKKNKFIHTGRIIPYYSSTEKLKKKDISSRRIRRWILLALENLSPSRGEDNVDSIDILPEIIPSSLTRKYKFPKRYHALRNIHFPASEEEREVARDYLKYEELYLFQVIMYRRSLLRQKIKRVHKPISIGLSKTFPELEKTLPFELTSGQKKAIRDILLKCQSSSPCDFLIQGDVGSGKTLVALAVALHYLEAGIQTAFLAPTEVLARQHFLTFNETLGLQNAKHLELLISGGPKQERLEKLDRIARGEVRLVVGTHALMEENVAFKDLGLVVVDEQQRFGVKQREVLYSKGKNPDTIAMSATPIPRSLCLTEYSDLELISIREKPAGRKPIQTMCFGTQRRDDVYKSIRKYAKMSKQCYIIYPIIEESEKLNLKAATIAYEELRTNVFPEFTLALLHGRLKEQEKNSIMHDFRSGKTKILVSTSIIEVGVNVPNATIMVVEHAERFGISQLHQFRGRVGRSTEQSFCVLFSDANGTETRERLEALVESQDGFYLAEKDLEIRGTGEFLGLKQHGFSELRLCNLVYDRQLSDITYHDARSHSELSSLAQEFICQRFPKDSMDAMLFQN